MKLISGSVATIRERKRGRERERERERDLLLLALNTEQNTNIANLFSDHLRYITEVHSASLRLS